MRGEEKREDTEQSDTTRPRSAICHNYLLALICTFVQVRLTFRPARLPMLNDTGRFGQFPRSSYYMYDPTICALLGIGCPVRRQVSYVIAGHGVHGQPTLYPPMLVSHCLLPLQAPKSSGPTCRPYRALLQFADGDNRLACSPRTPFWGSYLDRSSGSHFTAS